MKSILIASCSLVLNLCSAVYLYADTETQWLKVADSYRQSSDNFQVTTRVRLYKQQTLEKEKFYEVYTKPGQKSLVLFKSNAEKGQKVLMIADKFWMIMPKSRRPIRITPMQKLLGEASTGDIATIQWHDNYRAVTEPMQEINGQKVNILFLTAVRKGLSYQSIRLFLVPEKHQPIKAEFYTGSGKLLKKAEFVIGTKEGRERVSKMILTDEIDRGRITEVAYLKTRSHNLSNKFFNAQFLAQNRALVIQ